MFRYFVLFFGICVVLIVGCGVGDDPLLPGEEVVVEEWTDPVDIGKEYGVGDVEVGDTVTLSTGEQFQVGEFDTVDFMEGAGWLFTTRVPVPDRPRVFKPTQRGFVVPDGPPIVFIAVNAYKNVRDQVRKDDNIQDRVGLSFAIKVDRVLDYNLPIYLEYQVQMRKEFGGEVRRVRLLTVVRKGGSFALHVFTEDDPHLSVGDPEKHERACLSILPYTEMEKIALPASVDVSPDISYYDMPLEDRIIPAGHTFRPYRIASSSFLMGVNSVERNW